MKSRDLMLGNYIKHSESKELCIVRRIGSNLATVGITGRKIFGYNKVFEPIPLTEEILQKCGFTYKFDIFTLGRYHFNLINGLFYSGNDHVSSGNYDSKNIRFLHQLQNLIYTLTGKHLEIEL